MRVVLDGGNGMAGPMVGPLLELAPDRAGADLLGAGRRVPRPRAQPAARGEPALHRRQGPRARARTSASPGTGTPTAASSSTTRGEFVAGDFLTALLAESMLRKEPGATVLYDVRASRAVRDIVERAGGTAQVNRVGHAFFKTRMRETGAAFGGEVSGHYYFRDFYCADSGTIPALLILELLSVEGKRMSELLEPLRVALLHLGRDQLRGGRPGREDGGDRRALLRRRGRRLDGVSVDYDDWHFNVRPSNTEPLLRLNLESLVSPEHMERAARRGARR